MFGLATTLLGIVQWAIFFALIALVARIAWLIARWRGFDKRGQRKAAIIVAAIAFAAGNIPNARTILGEYYFDYLCKSEAGEFIYKTVDNVEGLYQMRPRDPRDYIDRVRAGDIPEDPYGHTNWEAQHPETLFVSPPWSNYRFLETPLPNASPDDPVKYRRFFGYQQDGNSASFIERHGYAQVAKPMQEEHVATLKSRYGYTWHGIDHPFDKLFGVYGGETVVNDLQTGEVLARKRGFVRVRWAAGLCPAGKSDEFMYTFISKVLKPYQPDTKVLSGVQK